MKDLNKREMTIIKMICNEKANYEIAEKLELSLRRTEKLKRELYDKTKTGTNVGLLKWAVKNKLYTIK